MTFKCCSCGVLRAYNKTYIILYGISFHTGFINKLRVHNNTLRYAGAGKNDFNCFECRVHKIRYCTG